MSVAMSVAPSASSLSCSCLQGCGMAQYGQALGCRLWAGCACKPREHTHRPEPAVAVGSRGEPQLPAISRNLPAPLLSCAALVQLPRDSRWQAAAPPGVRPGTHTHTHLLFGQLRLQIVQRMREAGEALRAQLELRRRRLALGLERDLGGGCQWRQGMQEDAGEMYALNETRWVLVSGGLVVWWSGSLVVWRLTSGFWFLGHPPHLGGASEHSPSGTRARNTAAVARLAGG